jgi:hypothetical protein
VAQLIEILLATISGRLESAEWPSHEMISSAIYPDDARFQQTSRNTTFHG